MMIHAYPETYLSKAQAVVGEAFDYAVNICGIPGDTFARQFVVSSVSKRLENGEPALIAGKSGVELAADIIEETTGSLFVAEPVFRSGRSAEYWIGWAVAYYQWLSSRSYSEIFRIFTFDELKKMYFTLHEADVSKFAGIADRRMREFFPDTNLKRIRTLYGLTQRELAQRSGVSLRSIQMYEQRNKDINRANSETLYRISKILGCTMEDLIEK